MTIEATGDSVSSLPDDSAQNVFNHKGAVLETSLDETLPSNVGGMALIS